MIAYLEGEVMYRGQQFAIIQVAGVGYRVFFPEDRLKEVSGTVRVYTHEVIREDSRELYGFLEMDALELFWKLLSVSGVGPRMAQKITYRAPVEQIREKIMQGDLAFLTGVPGIGKKTAQKIILELKGALVQEPVSERVNQEALEALVGLGYHRRQAEEALAELAGEDTEELIRAALRVLSR